MEVTTEAATKILTEVTAEIAIEITSRTELNFNYSSSNL